LSTNYTFKELKEITTLDTIKQQLAKERGISLITIPCWWDGREDR